jgi:Ala-tRNA(Pro) deacylase
VINDPDHKVSLFLDSTLQTDDRIYAHPLVNDMTIGITGSDLQQFLAHTGHQLRWLDF